MLNEIDSTDKNILMMASAGYGKSFIIHKLREMNPSKYIITSTMSNSARMIDG